MRGFVKQGSPKANAISLSHSHLVPIRIHVYAVASDAC